MNYEVDNDYAFDFDEYGIPALPDGLTTDGSLYVLPNGKYLPRGFYRTEGGGDLIYEPFELGPFADMLASSKE